MLDDPSPVLDDPSPVLPESGPPLVLEPAGSVVPPVVPPVLLVLPAPLELPPVDALADPEPSPVVPPEPLVDVVGVSPLDDDVSAGPESVALALKPDGCCGGPHASTGRQTASRDTRRIMGDIERP